MTDYARDILSFLRSRELKVRPWNGTSPQLSARRPLVDWLSQIRDRLHLEHDSLHLAVKIMDLFMDGHDIEQPQLYFVALVSLLLASKIEEKANRVPKVPTLNSFVENTFPVIDYTHLEVMILKFFDWKIALPTPLAFVGLLRPCANHCLERRENETDESFQRLNDNFDAFVQYFVDISLQDERLVRELPSRVGSAILLSARVALNLRPHWPVPLQIASSLSVQTIAKPAERLLAVYDEASKTQSTVYVADSSPSRSQGQNFDEVERKAQRSPDDGYYSPIGH